MGKIDVLVLFVLFFLAFDSTKTKKKRLLEKNAHRIHYVIKVDSVLYKFTE